jgi:hypothetical protein
MRVTPAVARGGVAVAAVGDGRAVGDVAGASVAGVAVGTAAAEQADRASAVINVVIRRFILT